VPYRFVVEIVEDQALSLGRIAADESEEAAEAVLSESLQLVDNQLPVRGNAFPSQGFGPFKAIQIDPLGGRQFALSDRP
jgi:hypothetical protein